MATVHYLYRSKKEKANLTLRLLYAYDKKNYSFFARTEIKMEKEYWEGDYKAEKINDLERLKKRNAERDKLESLEIYVLGELDKIKDQSKLSTEWLKDIIKEYHNPTPETPDEPEQPKAPSELIPFFEFYLSIRENSLSKNRKKKIGVTKRKLERYSKAKKTKLKISDINDNFLNSFLDYGKKEKYSKQTLKGDLSILKTLCRYALQHGIKISPQLDKLQIKAERNASPYLNIDEIKAISDLEITGYLANARDWLVISCYTGQRISDFMRFSSDMVVVDEADYFLEFEQQKTQKKMYIPFLHEALAVYKANGNKFPRAISHQKYNSYIKEVCKLAGINEPMTGNVRVSIAEDENNATKGDFRVIRKEVPKYELITSHIGRRSFATNYYGKLPTSDLILVTGHSGESQLLNYLQKTSTEEAKQVSKRFAKLR